ncbi:MAG: FRG domain-containing protein [bacterium]
MKSAHPEAPISVSSFLRFIEETKTNEIAAGNNSDFLFRGQCIDEPLLPRIARLYPKGTLHKIEGLIMDDFKRQSPPFTEFEPKSQWDWLALAQHHGLPTRLLDWSYSALAALWFCVNKPLKKDKDGNHRDGVIWLLKTQPDDFLSFSTMESPYRQGKTRIFRSRAVSRRILAFTCHRRIPTGRFVPLEDNVNFKGRLLKIPIPSNRYMALREQLTSTGVHSVSLFPDLDGLSRHLEFRYFHD